MVLLVYPSNCIGMNNTINIVVNKQIIPVVVLLANASKCISMSNKMSRVMAHIKVRASL